MIGRVEETSASFEARSAPRSYPTVLAAAPDRAHPRQPRQPVDRALDRKRRLRGAVAAEAAGGDHVGVNGIADGLLVGASVTHEWAAQGAGERLAAMAAIGAGVGDDVDLERGQRAV